MKTLKKRFWTTHSLQGATYGLWSLSSRFFFLTTAVINISTMFYMLFSVELCQLISPNPLQYHGSIPRIRRIIQALIIASCHLFCQAAIKCRFAFNCFAPLSLKGLSSTTTSIKAFDYLFSLPLYLIFCWQPQQSRCHLTLLCSK